jgi:hypothetical protein
MTANEIRRRKMQRAKRRGSRAAACSASRWCLAKFRNLEQSRECYWTVVPFASAFEKPSTGSPRPLLPVLVRESLTGLPFTSAAYWLASAVKFSRDLARSRAEIARVARSR